MSDLQRWVDELQSADWRKVMRAEEALAAAGAPAARAIARVVQYGEGAPPVGALRALVRLGSEALPVLHEALFAASARRRRGAVEAVAEIGDRRLWRC